MARSLAELANTTNDELFAGIVDSLLKIDEVTAALVANAGVTDRPTIKYNRLASVPTPVYADCSTTFTSQAISGSAVSVDLLTLAVQFNVCDIGQNLYSSYTDVVASELQGALKGMSEKLGTDAVGNGNGSSAIYGLNSVATNSFAIAGGSVDVGDLDRLIDEVKDKSDRCFFVGAPATVRKVVAELRAESGGMDYQTLAGTAFRTPAYMGYNLLKHEDVTSGALYFVNPDTGYKLYFGEKADQNVANIFGLQELGHSQTKMEKLWRLYAHIAGVSVNPQGIAELTGI
jgi:hypothetical protein